MPWVLRGLRDGVVTTRYPQRGDDYADRWPGAVAPRPGRATLDEEYVAGICPTQAISVSHGEVRVDRGRCILCGRCISMLPDMFTTARGAHTGALQRDALVVAGDRSAADLPVLRAELRERVQAFGRSVHIRHLDSGSDGSDEWEVQALWNPVYDVHRLGIYLTASPRHADVLLVTGCGAHGMEDALRETYDAMPHPKVVMAVGTDAISGGIVSPTYATRSGVLDSVPVDVLVPGSPPSPFSILHGLLLVLGRLPASGRPK